MKKMVLIAILFLNLQGLLAGKYSGYIITNESDTVYGKIKVSVMDSYSGAWIVSGINLEPLHSRVYFKADKQRKYKAFLPGEIKEFGFARDDVNYYFKSFEYEVRSLVVSQRIRKRFLSLVYKGELAIYQNIENKVYPLYSPNRPESVDYNEYFLYDEKHGLHKIQWTKEYQTFKELLELYEVDEQFLNQIEPEKQFRNLLEILMEYDEWKAGQELSHLKT